MTYSTWRNYELATSSVSPSGFNLFQTAFVDSIGTITSFVSGANEIQKYVKNDLTEIRYLKKYFIPNQLAAYNVDTDPGFIYRSDDSLTWTSVATISILGDVVYGGGYWYACDGTEVIRSSDRINWTSVHTISTPYTDQTLSRAIVGANGELHLIFEPFYSNFILYSTNNGASFYEGTTTFAYSDGFYMDGKFRYFNSSNYSISTLTSCSDLTILSSFAFDDSILLPYYSILSPIQGGIMFMQTDGSNVYIGSLSTAPTANGWSGTEIDRFTISGLVLGYPELLVASQSNFMIIERNGGYIRHSSGNYLEISTKNCWWDSVRNKWFYHYYDDIEGYLLKSTVDLSSSTTETTNMPIDWDSRVTFRDL